MPSRATSHRAALAALALLAGACRTDPVPQASIDALPTDEGAPSATHRPGEACLLCHTKYVGASPEMAVGGTIYTYVTNADGRPSAIKPAPNVVVFLTDSNGDTKKALTNSAGNFWIERDKWEGLAYPLLVQAGRSQMRSLVGREGSCAACHALPTDDAIDPVTGASQRSPGVVIVDPSDVGGGAAQ